jgi:3-oxoacyl-[acyl-carrier protein] reductase
LDLDKDFQGRVALVTGAAGVGIGQAIARRFAAGGATVVVTDIHEARTTAIVKAISADYPDSTVIGHVLDVGDRQQIDSVVREVLDEVGPIRILVNSAAVNVIGSIFESDPADWDWVMAVSVSGPWYLCRATMPLMRAAGGGVIVNISTPAPDVGGRGQETPYAVAKAGLNALSRACAFDGGPHNIRAVTVTPGLVRGTKFADEHPELFESTAGPLARWPEPIDVAEAVAFLASDRAKCITGEALYVTSGGRLRG